MIEPRKFRTKYGFCHVLKDRIVFTHAGIFGQIGDIAGEEKMIRVLLLFAVFSLCSFYFSIENFLTDELIWAVVFATIGGYLLYGILINLNTTLHPIISREQITEVKYVKSKGILSYSIFEIRFKNKKGKIKKRIIALPRDNSKNQENLRTALGIMGENGLVKE